MAEGSRKNVLALDVGGSHISAALFNFEDNTLGDVGHVLIPEGASANDFLDALGVLSREILPGPVPGVAAAMPNPFDYARGVSYMKHKFQQLYGVDLRLAFSQRLECDESNIFFLNDAAAYLAGELHQGAAVGVSRAVAITLGTGIGSAFAVGGRAVTDGVGVPPGGEIWNVPYLGGIVEDWAGTAAILRLYSEMAGAAGSDQVGVHDIAKQAAGGGQASIQTFERFGTELGKLLRFTMADFRPQRIVVGGGIARSAALFFPAAQRELADLAIELRISVLSDRAPLIGAAIRWLERSGRA